MKKILIIALFSIGFFSMSQAQSLDYYVANADPIDTWDWAMDDAGPFPAIYELGITPGQLRTGSIPFLFSFPLEWKAVDNNNCQIYQFCCRANSCNYSAFNLSWNSGILSSGYYYPIRAILY